MLARSAAGLRATLIPLFRVALGLLLLALIGLEGAQVTLRYLFAEGVVWGRDVSTLLLLSLAWVGAPLLWLSHAHIAVDLLRRRLRPPGDIAFDRLVNALMAVAAAVFVLMTIEAIRSFSVIELPALGVSAAVKFYPVLVGSCLMLLAAVVNLATPSPAIEPPS